MYLHITQYITTRTTTIVTFEFLDLILMIVLNMSEQKLFLLAFLLMILHISFLHV